MGALEIIIIIIIIINSHGLVFFFFTRESDTVKTCRSTHRQGHRVYSTSDIRVVLATLHTNMAIVISRHVSLGSLERDMTIVITRHQRPAWSWRTLHTHSHCNYSSIAQSLPHYTQIWPSQLLDIRTHVVLATLHTEMSAVLTRHQDSCSLGHIIH